MILSSDELEVLEYLKSWKGNHVSLVEICRSAGGRRKFRESPQWAKGLMARLVDSQMVSVNERGHYAFIMESSPAPVEANVPEDYFPTAQNAIIVGDDYFPPPEAAAGPAPAKTKRWVSPQIENILKKAGKKSPKPRETAAKPH